jgi:glycosyltransferase involved in cell wall biosynthesis
MTDVRGPVAIVAAGELFGGAERHVLGLGDFLRERGLRPQIILFHDRELASRCHRDGLPVSILPVRGGLDRRGPKLLDELLGRLSARVVHVHGYRAAVNVALGPTARPTVCTFHGQGEPSWRSPRVFLKDRIYRGAEALACHRRQAVVCFVTDDLRQRHAGRYRGLPLRTVHNGLRPLERSVTPSPEPALVRGRLHAIAAGRLTRVKGLEFAITALSLLPAGHPWQLDLVGDGGLTPHLRALAARLGVDDRVTFHGFQRDVESLLTRSDALVMPSLHEGLPYTLLEAMSLGLPVIASAVGGLGEVLRDGQTGLLVPVGDARALAGALHRLGGDPQLRRDLGLAAAGEQRTRYTLESMGEGYLEAYAAAGG